jgi:hypothetical protein
MKNEIAKLKGLHSKCKICSKVKQLGVNVSY